MNNLSFRTPLIYYLIITVTLMISFLSFCFPSTVNKYEIAFIILLILFIGIPHGATDHVVFNYLTERELSTIYIITNFYLFYIFLILAYSLCWYFFPDLSLIIFIIISAYHLGQSNLYYLKLPRSKIIKTSIYFSWGIFVVFGPIISNFEEVMAILKNILGRSWIINFDNQEYFLVLVITLNFLIISTLFIFNYINGKELLRETLNLIALGLLFYTAPLMVSFGVYFGLWHSLSSTFDQIQFIQKYDLGFNLINFYFKSIPLSIISIVIFAMAYLFLVYFNNEYSQEDLNSIIGLFFIGLAVVTLPHTIIRDKLYMKN